MRQITLDTETTGLDHENGHRIIEIGCVEVLDRRLTNRNLHFYLNPEREIDARATEIHGMTLDDLRDKPRFADIADALLDFCADAEVIIHNAAFDIGFLDAELGRLEGLGKIRERCAVEDTLLMARQRFPGQRNSLDALCKRLGVDNSHRQLHGALLDAQLLLDVYIALTSGQSEIGFASDTAAKAAQAVAVVARIADPALRPRVQVDGEEAVAHAARLAALQKKAGRCLWLEVEQAS